MWGSMWRRENRLHTLVQTGDRVAVLGIRQKLHESSYNFWALIWSLWAYP